MPALALAATVALLPGATPGAAAAPPSGTPGTAAPCLLTLGPGTSVALTVTPGRGRLRLSWQQPSDWSGITGWQVATVARPSQATPVTWRAVKAGAACATVTVTLRGLTSGTAYEVWLEADSPDYTIPGIVVTRLVARTTGVTVR